MIPERTTPEHLSEIEIVQNPALGAYALWRFGLGHQNEGQLPSTVAAAFLVLPLLFHLPTLELVKSTRKASGLQLFAAKLGEAREDLLAIHERALVLRRLSFQSIGLGASVGLLTLDYGNATIRANSIVSKANNFPVPERLKGISAGADKIGYWFSKAGLYQIASTLRVEF